MSRRAFDNVAMYIAGKIPSTDVRVLEGALIRVIAYASLTGREISLELAQDVLSNLERVDVERAPGPRAKW